MNEQDYCNYVSDRFFQFFKESRIIKQHVPGKMAAWQIVFKLKSYKVYVSAEKGFLDFHVITGNDNDLGLFSKNPKLFNDQFYTNKKNIDIIINFLYDHKDEIFVD